MLCMGGLLKVFAIKCIEGIDSGTNNSTTMPNMPGEYGPSPWPPTFQVVVYQTTSTQTHLLFGCRYSQSPLTTMFH